MFKFLKMAVAAGALVLMSQAANSAVLTFDTIADCSGPDVTITGGAGAETCGIGTGPGGTALVRSTILDPGDSFWTATFSGLASAVSIDLGDYGADVDRLFINAYNLADVLIEMVQLDILATDNSMRTLTLVASDIAKITFGVTGEIGRGGIYADNLNYSLAAVPIPAAGLLLIGALGGLGLVGRRRKKNQ